MGWEKRITKGIKIDGIDVAILKILSADARENQNIIAKKCGITPVAVLRRIKKLKETGVIIGPYLILDKEMIGNPYEVTVLVDACNNLESEVKDRIRQIENVLICAESIGRYNLCVFIVTHDINELNETICKIRNIQGVKNVNTNIWTGHRHRNFERDLKVSEI
jgi:Lrp/AsnC family transcriptional regulator, leucine-responsive regulatory protein